MGSFEKPIHTPNEKEEARHKTRQEAVRKDIEICLGVLHGRWRMLRMENQYWFKEDIAGMSECCIILLNMIIKMNEENLFYGEFYKGGNVVLLEEFYTESAAKNGGKMDGGKSCDTWKQ